MIGRMQTGVFLAYTAIIAVTAAATFNLVPVYVHMMIDTCAVIYIGSHNSISLKDKDNVNNGQGQAEVMKTKDAYMFPVIGSCVLFSLYCVFKFLPKEYVNLAIKGYFFVFGLLVLGNKIRCVLALLLPKGPVDTLEAVKYTIPLPGFLLEEKKVAKKDDDADDSEDATPATEKIPVQVTKLDLLGYALASVHAVWYLKTNHWVASNVLGMAFSIQGIEMLSLGSFFNGAVLLSGLFVYDVFWVFGTDVMVTVAKSFDAPIKLLFPQMDAALRPSLLGLGDIVIPGIFIALMLRFDRHLQPQQSRDTYFKVVMVSYFLGLTTTVFVMYYFKAAQPALLYLVPACLGSTTLAAAVKGQFKELWVYSEEEEEEEEKEEEGKDDKKSQ